MNKIANAIREGEATSDHIFVKNSPVNNYDVEFNCAPLLRKKNLPTAISLFYCIKIDENPSLPLGV